VAEQLAFKQLSGQGSAVNRDKDLVGAVACTMDLARDHFFSDACFAGYYDGTFARGDGVYHFENRTKGGRFADEFIDSDCTARRDKGTTFSEAPVIQIFVGISPRSSAAGSPVQVFSHHPCYTSQGTGGPDLINCHYERCPPRGILSYFFDY
jgi:hypothetical protein